MLWGKKKGGKLVDKSEDGAKGTITLADGSEYTGDLQGGLAHGEGTITFADGRRLSGTFEGGNPHGQNLVLTFPDGRKYVGEYRHGRRHGLGEMFFPEGKKFEGEWRNDQPHGDGMMIYPDGTRERGKWIRGNKLEQNTPDKTGNEPNHTTYLVPIMIVLAGVFIYLIL